MAIYKTPARRTPEELERLSHWSFAKDDFGDWRGIHESGNRRTRLKASMTTAQNDVLIGRVQRRVGDEWRDDIDRFDREQKEKERGQYGHQQHSYR